MSRVMCVVVLVLALGCGERRIPAKEVIPLDQVPANVMKVAKEKLPDVKFDRAWKNTKGEYEIAGKNKAGKVREIDITPDGVVVEIE